MRGLFDLLRIAVHLKPIRSDIGIVTTREDHLEGARLTRVQVSAVDIGEITPYDNARSIVHSAHWADILNTRPVVVAYLADDLIPTKGGIVRATIVEDGQVR